MFEIDIQNVCKAFLLVATAFRLHIVEAKCLETQSLKELAELGDGAITLRIEDGHTCQIQRIQRRVVRLDTAGEYGQRMKLGRAFDNDDAFA
jgi:hypothetical protein